MKIIIKKRNEVEMDLVILKAIAIVTAILAAFNF
jgi:hypothetical protein